MRVLRGGKNPVRFEAEYPERERNANRLTATEICNVRLMCLVRNTDVSNESIAKR